MLAFICFAAYVVSGHYLQLLTAALILLSVFVLLRIKPSSETWRMMWRLRILFISIAIIYFWFTPGELVIPVMRQASPTFEGLWQGTERIYALMLLLIASRALIDVVPRSDLIAGLYCLAQPLQLCGVSRERLVVRLMLTMDTVFDEQRLLKQPYYTGSGITQLPNNKVRQLSEVLKRRFDDIVNDQYEPRNIEFIPLQPPSVWQWLGLSMLVSILFGLL